MPQQNLISINIPQTVISEASRKVMDAFDLLNPYISNLPKDDVKRLFKQADETMPFVDKTMEYMALYPQFKPDRQLLNEQEMQQDQKTFQQARTLEKVSNTFSAAVAIMRILSGSDALDAAMAFYHHVKLLADRGVPGAKEVYDDLQQRFPSTRKKRED